ncbi:MAG: hypothetical protein F2681_09130 [Actinobacteria bacterium]|jgi:hypothetical protein|uniref:Unannotated protein n=1 Tax=freshwater metagenome TaxID=449393 RepID=A0A6J7N5G7_9ZZZZ|nr:hypothetical protein [Actinomycetota bacterium]MSW78151.1 hypothetical protein [Actinomycetota bacterium]MSX94885.1 hypothetical protein [Actinomycetota bacterium]MSZ83292.1 hypothetical protein [Actinomycetota bacterium]MTB18328.1 hypothetical protein [Actinomycetota bacterium]
MSRIRNAFVAAALVVVTIPGVAHASTSVTAGTNKCTVTAIAPTLKGTLLTATATVLCTSASSVAVLVGVVELDGTVEDLKVEIPVKSIAVAVSANKLATITTATVTCVSTETGNEEFATKAAVNIAGTVSAYDRTVPKLDSYAC